MCTMSMLFVRPVPEQREESCRRLLLLAQTSHRVPMQKSHLCHFFFSKTFVPSTRFSHTHTGTEGSRDAGIRQRKHSGVGPSGENTTKPPRLQLVNSFT